MRKHQSIFTRTLYTLAVASLGLALTPSTARAEIFADFQVDQTLFSDCELIGPCVIDADKMVGGYTESFEVTAPGEFSVEAYWDLTAFFVNEGEDLVSTPWLNFPDTLISDGYAVYALFTANGTFTGSPATGFEFTSTTGSVSLFLDQFVDSEPSVNPLDVDNNADDLPLASAPLISGDGSGAPLPCDPILEACGDFALTFNPFTLTVTGMQFFSDPDPFYLTAVLKGQFNTFDPGPVGTITPITGSADAFFAPLQAPEPASLILFGVGLMGAGIAARRRRTE